MYKHDCNGMCKSVEPFKPMRKFAEEADQKKKRNLDRRDQLAFKKRKSLAKLERRLTAECRALLFSRITNGGFRISTSKLEGLDKPLSLRTCDKQSSRSRHQAFHDAENKS